MRIYIYIYQIVNTIYHILRVYLGLGLVGDTRCGARLRVASGPSLGAPRRATTRQTRHVSISALARCLCLPRQRLLRLQGGGQVGCRG